MQKDWLGFSTKKELRAAVLSEIEKATGAERRQYVEFESSLLSRLFNQRHYFCKATNTTPTKFRWGYEGTYGTIFQVFIVPTGWKAMSFNKAIDGTTFEDHCSKVLRDYVRDIMDGYRIQHPVCELCQGNPSIDVHHRHPPFKLLAEFCVSLVTQEDKDWMLQRYLEQDETEIRILPENHPAAIACRLLHKEVVFLQALCKECHKAVTHGGTKCS